MLRKEKKSGSRSVNVCNWFKAGLAVEAAENPEEQGISARVVSMPCMELFEEQTKEYKEIRNSCKCEKTRCDRSGLQHAMVQVCRN